MIEIALYKGRSRPFDRLVQWWTRGPYSHAEVVTHRANSGAAWCISSSWMDGGVRGKWIVLDPAKWDVIALPHIDSAVAHSWLAAHVGARYDWAGLLGFVWRPQTGALRRWFCSEVAAHLLGLPQSWRFSPNDLAAIAHALAVYALLHLSHPPQPQQEGHDGR